MWPSADWRPVWGLFMADSVTVACINTRLLMECFVCFEFRPGDRIKVTDDSNEDWWKVSCKGSG